jgi:hypothetical protein
MGLAPQLERIAQELEAARGRAHAIAAPLTEEDWGRRPAPDQWSVAECLAHLNLTSEAFLPLIRVALRSGRERHLVGAGPFRRDPVGWFVYGMTEPPVRFPVKTTEAFVPGAVGPKARVLETFDALQAQLVGCVRTADGLDLRRLRIRSPFAARLRYNLYSCLTIIPAHQRQHLAQAEEAGRAIAVT